MRFEHGTPQFKLVQWCSAGFSFIRGQGHFYFAKGTFIGKSLSLWDTFEGKGRQGQKKRENRGHDIQSLNVISVLNSSRKVYPEIVEREESYINIINHKRNLQLQISCHV